MIDPRWLYGLAFLIGYALMWRWLVGHVRQE